MSRSRRPIIRNPGYLVGWFDRELVLLLRQLGQKRNEKIDVGIRIWVRDGKEKRKREMERDRERSSLFNQTDRRNCRRVQAGMGVWVVPRTSR